LNKIRFCDRVFSPFAHHQTIVHRGGSRTAPAVVVGPFNIRRYAITVLLLNLTARLIVGGKKK